MSDQPDVAALVTQIEDWLLYTPWDPVAESLLRSCLAALKGQMWQPIATAPKDLTTVDGYTPYEPVIMGDVYYDPNQEGWRRLPDTDRNIRPTHWRWPAPPASTPEER